MTIPAPTASTYRVDFTRVGRVDNPPSLTVSVAAGDDDALASKILTHTRQYHGSRERCVVFDGDVNTGQGWVMCGARDGGRFTYTRIQ